MQRARSVYLLVSAQLACTHTPYTKLGDGTPRPRHSPILLTPSMQLSRQCLEAPWTDQQTQRSDPLSVPILLCTRPIPVHCTTTAREGYPRHASVLICLCRDATATSLARGQKVQAAAIKASLCEITRPTRSHVVTISVPPLTQLQSPAQSTPHPKSLTAALSAGAVGWQPPQQLPTQTCLRIARWRPPLSYPTPLFQPTTKPRPLFGADS